MGSARLLPALILLPIAAAGLAPSAAADPSQSIGFTVLPAVSQSWEMTVPSRGPVWIEVYLDGASATGFALDGPGACSGVTIEAAPSTPLTPSPMVRVDCGFVQPANGVLEIGALGGAARGTIVLHGITVA